eukprot:4026409-Pleurochrysis_carterae.AAC.1
MRPPACVRVCAWLRACVRECVRACVVACVRAWLRACVFMHAFIRALVRASSHSRMRTHHVCAQSANAWACAFVAARAEAIVCARACGFAGSDDVRGG